jgi:protein-tyrosine-phosphatase
MIDPVPRVLFLCPHGAAKSVAAAAFLSLAAARRGFAVVVDNAGTHPDPEINPIVLARLESDRLPNPGVPRLVTGRDLRAADRIISIGCDLGDLATDRHVEVWSVPDFSVDPGAAFAAIERQVDALVADLASER